MPSTRVPALLLSLLAFAPAGADDVAERARRLHRDAIVIDTHLDAPDQLAEKWADLKKSSRFTGLVAALMGATFLLMILGNPRVEALHGSDVLGLVASGGLLGVGFVGLMGRLNFASSRKDQSRPPRNE